MSLSRTYRRATDKPWIVGMGDGDDVDVASFIGGPIRFIPEGQGATDDFLLQRKAWESLGEPSKVKVTVEAA